MSTVRVDAYVDPGCPWTWLTSRWLVDVARQGPLEVRWRAFSLRLLHGDRAAPRTDTPERRDRVALVTGALRVIEALADAGEHEAGERFHLELGRRVHEERRHRTPALLREAGAAAGIGALVDAADDDRLDHAVQAALDEALRLAGPDVGSPVLHVAGDERGLFGPIVSPAPTGEDAVRLWDALTVLRAMPSFHEAKRGRTGRPQIERTGPG